MPLDHRAALLAIIAQLGQLQKNSGHTQPAGLSQYWHPHGAELSPGGVRRKSLC
jgi:hypothetical protein